MKEFGAIFKKFRKSRGIRLKDVAKAGISTSQLSRFEKGQTDLTITKFMLILDEINMPIDEFMYAVHDFHRDDLNELLSKIRLFVSTHDIDGLKKLLSSQLESEPKREKFHHINTILLKIRLQDLSGESYYTQQDLADLTDYLFSVEYWGYYELLIFAKEMSTRSDFYKEIPNNRRMISTMLLNVYITCIEREELIDALYFEKQLNQCFFIETEIYERLVFQYAQNYYQYKKEGNNQSIIEMKKYIGAMKLAGSEHIAKTYEAHLKKLIEENS